GDDVGVVDGLQEDGDTGRLVLAVAVHRHQHVHAALHGVSERGDQGSAVAAVVRVGDDRQVGPAGEQFAGAGGRAVVDDEDLGAVAADLVQHGVEVPLFVVDRNGGQQLHTAPLPGCKARTGKNILTSTGEVSNCPKADPPGVREGCARTDSPTTP